MEAGFCGHADAGWELKPKLYRDGALGVEKLFRFEEELRGEFKRRGSQLAEGLKLPAYDDEWGWYSLMQHYGAPTRLLDWSDGALTALYFAVRETRRDDQVNAPGKSPPDACVWMLDPYRLNLLSFYPGDDSFGVALPDWEAAEDYVTGNIIAVKSFSANILWRSTHHTFSGDSLPSKATLPSSERVLFPATGQFLHRSLAHILILIGRGMGFKPYAGAGAFRQISATMLTARMRIEMTLASSASQGS